MDAYIERLRQVPLFADCTDKELAHLARVIDEVQVPAERELTTQGTFGREAFILLSGSARVIRNGEQIVTLRPGDYFGELSLLDAGARTATIITDEPSDLLVMGRQQFNTVLDDVPGLARRLLVSTARLLHRMSGDEIH